MRQLQLIRQAVCLPTLLMGLSTVMAGTSIASIRGGIHPLPLILSIAFVAMAQIASNAFYSYNDLRSHLAFAAALGIEGRRHRNDTLESYATLREFAVAAALIAMTIGVVLAGYAGEWLLLLGALVVLMAYLNVEGPFPLVSTPFGPMVTFILFGPVGVVGVYLLQFTETSFAMLSWFDIGPAIYIGCAVGFMAAIAHIAWEYPRYRDSVLLHRNTFVTDTGRRMSRLCVFVCGFGMWGMFYAMTTGIYFQHPLIDMVMPTLCLGVNIWVVHMMRKYPRPVSRYPLELVAMWNMFFLYMVTMLLFITIGAPNVNVRDYVVY